MKDNDAFNLDDTRKRLQQWGAWCHHILTMGLDFSGQTIIGQLSKYQGTISKGTNPNFIPENKAAEEIDELINQYGKVAPEKARILSIQYVLQASMKEKLKQSQLPKHKYYRYLLNAEQWINRRL